jgi:hypothetical protein
MRMTVGIKKMNFTKNTGRSIFVITLLSCAPFISPNRAFAEGLEFRVTQTKHFTVHFAEELTPAELGGLKADIEEAYVEVSRGLAEIIGGEKINRRPIEVVIFRTTGDFTSLTKLPWWSASCVKGGAIYLQPMRTLQSRGILNEVIRHEIALVLIGRLSGEDGPPVWLAEGLAVHLSGEIERLRSQTKGERPKVSGTDDIDTILLNRVDIDKNRWGYILAYEAVAEIIEGGSEKEIGRLLSNGR